MNIRRLHKTLVTERYPLLITIVMFIVIRLLWNDDRDDLFLWITALVQIVIAFFLLYLTQTFALIRSRTLLPAFFFLLLSGTGNIFYFGLQGSLVALGILFCFSLLFKSYHNPQSQILAFNISLILTLAHFLWEPVLLFFPLFWYGMYRFRSLNFRTFFACIVGFLVIYLFLFAWSIYQDDIDFFLNVLPNLGTWLHIHPFQFVLREFIIIAFLLFLFILSGTKIFLSDISEKIKTIEYLRYLFTFALITFAFLVLQSEWKKECILILYLPLSLLFAHFFTLARRKISIWLLLLSIVFFIAMYFWKQIVIYL
jgi:hypothetical protein